MTDDDNATVRVFVMEPYEDFCDVFTDTSPQFPEAVMDFAAIAEFGHVDFVDFEILNPVLVGTGAAERKDNESAALGDSDETWCMCQELVFFLGLEIFTMIAKSCDIVPLRYRHVISLFYIWTIAFRITITRALQEIACRIVVTGPVRSRCKLRKEAEVPQ